MYVQNRRFREDAIVAPYANVSSTKLNQQPWQSLCRVEALERDGGNWKLVEWGTGWLVAPHTVITACHVLQDHSGGYSQRKFRVYFPAGDIEIDTIDARCAPGYVLVPSAHYAPDDVAGLRLPSPAPVPPLQLAGGPPASGNATIAGFPNLSSRRFVTHSYGFIAPPANNDIILHQISTNKGHSGAPVVTTGPSGSQVIGLHVAGTGGNPLNTAHPLHNVALRINRLASDIQTWASAWG